MRVVLVAPIKIYDIGAAFCRALKALGHEYVVVDEEEIFGKLQSDTFPSIVNKAVYRAFVKNPINYWSFNRKILKAVDKFNPHVVLVVKGSSVSPDTLQAIKLKSDAFLINYATDDPFNPLATTRDIIDGIPFYDVYACTKLAIMSDVQKAGARKIVHVKFGYDPELHFQEFALTSLERESFIKDLVFVGGADPERFEFMERLTQVYGHHLTLYGQYWNRRAELKTYAKDAVFGRNYRLALSNSKIALCLLRHANRDTHTMRTFEIPVCGPLMIAEGTEEHRELYREDKDAVFFDSFDELLDKLDYYLKNESKRRSIAENGRNRVLLGRHTYKDRLIELLNLVN
jgi:spore maturation protein CgeB